MSYLVASPGRTGSLFTTMYLKNYLNHVTKTWFFYTHIGYRTTDIELENKNQVIHSHSHQIIPLLLDKYQLIIIGRDITEVAASHLWARNTGLSFHFYNNNIEEFKAKYQDFELYLEPNIFAKEFFRILHWYINAKPYYDQATIINYQQALSVDALNQIFNLEPIEQKFYNRDLPLAQPFNKWLKFSNEGELKTLGHMLMEKNKHLLDARILATMETK